MDLYERNTCSFVVKVWLEPNGETCAQPAWRGQVTHVFTGHRQSFEQWATLTNFITAYLKEMGACVASTEPPVGTSA